MEKEIPCCGLCFQYLMKKSKNAAFLWIELSKGINEETNTFMHQIFDKNKAFVVLEKEQFLTSTECEMDWLYVKINGIDSGENIICVKKHK